MDDLLSSSLKRKASMLEVHSQRISSNSLRRWLTSMLSNEKIMTRTQICLVHTAGGQKDRWFWRWPADRLRAVSLFSWSVEQNHRDTPMTTCVTGGARLLGLPPSFLASRGFAAQRSSARALPLLNLKKKRDCSQSSPQMDLTRGLVSPIAQARVRLMSSR